MDLMGEIKIKQEQIDDYELDKAQTISSPTTNLSAQCIDLSDDQSDIIPLTRPPSDGLGLLSKETNSPLHATGSCAPLNYEKTVQDICLNEPCNDFIPSPTTTVDLSMQDVDVSFNTISPTTNDTGQDTPKSQSPTSQKRKRPEDEHQISQSIKKATCDNQDEVDIPQASNAQAMNSDVTIHQLHQQHNDRTTPSLSISQDDLTSKEQNSDEVSAGVDEGIHNHDNNIRKLYERKIEKLKMETQAIERQCITFRDLFLRFVGMHCKEKSGLLYQSIKKLSNEAGLIKQYVPEDQKCNVGVQVNLLPAHSNRNPALKFGSNALPMRRVEPNTASGNSHGGATTLLNSQASSNFKKANPRPATHNVTSVNTNSNHSMISGLTNGVSNNVRDHVINPSKTATVIRSSYQTPPSLTTYDYTRPHDPRLSKEKQSIFFAPPENIQKCKTIEGFKPELKLTKSPEEVKLIWKLPNGVADLDSVIGYDIFYATITNQMQPAKVSWKLLDTVKPLALPMVCRLAPLHSNRCYFAMRTKLKNDCYSPFSNICKVS